MGGKDYSLEDAEILKLNSPKTSVGGPFAVVYKNIEDRWVIVALDWDEKPRLGIRWFWGNGGNPFSSATPVWFIIPFDLTNSILDGLPLDSNFRMKLDEYFEGKIKGDKIIGV